MGQTVDIQPPVGLDPENDDCTLIAHAALVRGEVVAVDRTVTTADGAAISATNLTTDTWTKTRRPTASDVSNGIIAVALADIASGAKGQFRVSGIVDAKVASNVGANAEAGLRATADANFWLTTGTLGSGVATGTFKCVAYACNGIAVTATAAHLSTGLCKVWFNGINGHTQNLT